MKVSVVTTKGQVVIPAKLRKKYGIKIGTKIKFEEDDGEIILLPLTEDVIEKNRGILKSRGQLLKVLIDEKKMRENYK